LTNLDEDETKEGHAVATLLLRLHLTKYRGQQMSPIALADHALEAVIRELSLRILVPRMSDFDEVWEIANRVCDHYGLEKKAA
jgi:hypothetical protein